MQSGGILLARPVGQLPGDSEGAIVRREPPHARGSALLSTLKLFAPSLPYITEEIYLALFQDAEGCDSIHRSHWLEADESLLSEEAESMGEILIEIATAARRYKSESNLSLGTELQRLQLVSRHQDVRAMLEAARPDIKSVTRAREIEIVEELDRMLEVVKDDGEVRVGLLK